MSVIRRITFLLNFFFIMGVFNFPAHALTGVSFKLVNTLIEPDKIVVESFFQKVLKQIPPLALERMSDKIIEVSFKRSDAGYELGSTDQISHIVLDSFILETLKNKKFQEKTVSEWFKARSDYYKLKSTEEEKIYHAKHNTVEKLIDSVLIHEFFHIYDFLKYPQLDYLITRKECIQSAAARGPISFQPLPVACEKLAFVNSSVSTLPEYLHLAGWPNRGLTNLFSTPTAVNHNFEGSPFPYEYSSPRESFAVNMEYFLLDENFKCHRPLLYHYLARYFKIRPFNSSNNDVCRSTNRVLLSTANIFDRSVKRAEDIVSTYNIDFSRVYQIHYLFAGKSEDFMSKWGHSMFRIIICSPNRAEVGPDCMLDEDYHVVASFGAYVDQGEINPWDGLVGNYASYLFFYPFKKILNNYTVGELREVTSLPIKLSRNQKNAFLTALIEKHWSYRGEYKFLTNNCAVEALSIIQSALVFHSRVLDSSVVSPLGLLEILNKLNLVDKVPFADKTQAIKDGLYYPAANSTYDKAYQVLKGQFPEISALEFDDYVEQDPNYRRSLAEQIKLLKHAQTNLVKIAFALIETFAYSKFVREKLQHKISINDSIFELLADETKLKTKDVIEAISFLTAPQQSLLRKENYGIPLENEFNQDYTVFKNKIDLKKIEVVNSAIQNLLQKSVGTDDSRIIEDFTFNLNI